MKKIINDKNRFSGMRPFLTLLFTQSFSSLGSSMTAFALIVWSYSQQGSALNTALLSVCSYAPYVLVSVFAGALSDRLNKKRTLLVCDLLAAAASLTVMILLRTGALRIGHLYAINALLGLMNSVQQPASEVANTLLLPKERYQQASALRSVTSSLVSIATPALAAALMAFSGIETVILLDLATFGAAFAALLWFVPIPEETKPAGRRESLLETAGQGLGYLGENPGVLHMILFLAAINLTASMYNAALPALMLSRADETALGVVQSTTGAAMLLGGLFAAMLGKPRSRVRVICNCLLLSMSTENFCLAFGRSLPVWCMGAALGWLAIPLMNANLDALLRGYIPVGMQGRVYAVRNSLQFFTIPLGYLLGGALVDCVMEPMMAAQPADSLLVALFGDGKGAGAAALFAVLGVLGVATCLIFRRDRTLFAMEK